MLKIEIHESTPANMLRAIKAACDELLKDAAPERQILNEVVINLKKDEHAAQHVSEANRLNTAASAELDQVAASLSAHKAQIPDIDLPLDRGRSSTIRDDLKSVSGAICTSDEDVERLKKIGEGAYASGSALQTSDVDSSGAEWDAELHASTKTKNQDGTWKKRRGAAAPDAPPAPPVPPTPPVTVADPDSEKKIWALISGGVVTINQVQEVAAKHGCADLGALRGASADVKAAVLAELEQLP